jgi:hypothetical protein
MYRQIQATPFKFLCVPLALASVLLAGGCRNLKVNEKPSAGIVLPKSQMESDSVAVRVAVAEFDDLQQESLESFIGTTDQKLPLQTRQRLDDNGLRVSVVSNVNSARLQGLLAPRVLEPQWLTEQERELADAGKLNPIHRLDSQRHVEKRRGESFSMQISPRRAESTWQVFNGPNASSGQAMLAQCQMRITCWPQADGSVRMQFLPEIHHGQKHSKIGVDGQNFAVKQQREIDELRSLQFEVNVRPGETVLVAPTEKLERLGKLFFDASEPADITGLADSSILSSDSNSPINELFPILEKEQSLDASVLVELDQLEDQVKISGRPQPWQRMLLVRVVEVTPPAVH